MIQHKIISVVLAVVFVVTAHVFFKAYDRYVTEKCALRILTEQRARLETRQGEEAKKRRKVRRVNDFVSRAGSLGMVPSSWRRYDVDLEEPLSFQEAATVLQATVNSEFYYFAPESLHVRTAVASQKRQDPEAPVSPPEEGVEMEGKDLWLTLTGSFVVRNRH